MGVGYSTPKIASQYCGVYFDSLPWMGGKVIVITGTTTGIGFVVARTLVQKGAKVLMLNRPSPRATAALERLKNVAQESGGEGTAEHIDCDLQSFASVRVAADLIKASQVTYGVDILVNNAGALHAMQKQKVRQ
jgi:NAD(P)-dependent dehydrogenase (short-subunit alcohol dehydrogenase family)